MSANPSRLVPGLTRVDWGWLLLCVSLSALSLGAVGPHAESALPRMMALVPLFVAIKICRPWEAVACGLLWGAVVAASSTFFGHPGAFEDFILLTVGPAGFVFLGSYLTRRVGFSPFVLAVAWMVWVLILSWASDHPRTWYAPSLEHGVLHWASHVLGYVLVAFVAAYINALTIVALCSVCKRPGASTFRSGARLRSSILEYLSVTISKVAHLTSCIPRGPPLQPCLIARVDFC